MAEMEMGMGAGMGMGMGMEIITFQPSFFQQLTSGSRFNGLITLDETLGVAMVMATVVAAESCR